MEPGKSRWNCWARDWAEARWPPPVSEERKRILRARGWRRGLGVGRGCWAVLDAALDAVVVVVAVVWEDCVSAAAGASLADSGSRHSCSGTADASDCSTAASPLAGLLFDSSPAECVRDDTLFSILFIIVGCVAVFDVDVGSIVVVGFVFVSSVDDSAAVDEAVDVADAPREYRDR